MFTHVDRIHERDRQTDRWTVGHRTTAEASLMYRAAKTNHITVKVCTYLF